MVTESIIIFKKRGKCDTCKYEYHTRDKMIYEIIKFYKNPTIIVLCLLAIILSVVMPVFFIYDYEGYEYSAGYEKSVKGLEGVKLRRETVQKTKGTISVDKLNEALSLIKSLPPGDISYYKVEEKYPELYQFLRVAYAPFSEENIFLVKSIERADDYYSRNVVKIREKINSYSSNYFSEEERREALVRASNIEKPYRYDFVDLWAILFKALIFVYVVIVLMAVFISSQLYSFEKDVDMLIILKTAGIKKLRVIAYKKILAMVIYTTTVYLICTVITSSIVFTLIGTSGWNSQIQVMSEFYTSIYNWTFGDMFIKFIVIAWICVICIGSIGSVVNSIFQNTYMTFVITTLFALPPLFIQNNEILPSNVIRFLRIQPINGINLLSYIDSLFTYKIGEFRVLNVTMIAIFALGIMAISIMLSIVFFTKRQIIRSNA